MSSGPLKPGIYAASGADSDANGDTGMWTYVLTVSAGTIRQVNVGNSVLVCNTNTFSDQLNVTGATGAVTFTVTSDALSDPPLAGYTDSTQAWYGPQVSSTGAISISNADGNNYIGAGTYTLSGTATDAYGDSGTWTYVLTVTTS